jgi:DNA topoisomerase-1
MVKEVARNLGNTPSVSRASYIHPKIIERFLQDSFMDAYKQGRRGRSKKYQSLDEKAVLALLTTNE